MKSWGGILLGALGLALLDGVVSRSTAVNNVGGAVAKIGTALDWFLSPEVPAFKTTAKGSTTATASSATTSGSATTTTSQFDLTPAALAAEGGTSV